MKRLLLVWLLLALLALLLSGCGGGDVSKVTIADWEPSERYSDAQIRDAMEVVKAYFASEFEGCTLTELAYQDRIAECEEYQALYGVDEVIIITSSFDVDASGGDGSLEPNGSYTGWKWVLARNAGQKWEHRTHGYG